MQKVLVIALDFAPTTADYTTALMNQCLVANLVPNNLLVSISHCPLTATLNLECEEKEILKMSGKMIHYLEHYLLISCVCRL